jgi:hypothetical protein
MAMEIRMTGDKNKGNGDIRRDFPVVRPGEKRMLITGMGLTEAESDAFHFVKKH